MSLKVRFLRKCHTEKKRGRKIIKTKQWKSQRHRRCIERRSLFANSISNLYTKRLSPNSYQESVRYTSVPLRYLRLLRDSVCLLFKTFSLSPHISKEPLITLLLCLLLSCYHVSYYPVSCLPLPCTMSSITLSPLRNAKPQKKS